MGAKSFFFASSREISLRLCVKKETTRMLLKKPKVQVSDTTMML
jgi:hypothetical protein